MPDWDVIVIGAGSNGLVLAGELAALGARVLALEARLEAGGLLTTEECSVPGYWHNVLGALHNAFAATPPYQQLDLAREYARFAVPPVQAALPLRDGRALIFHTDVEATCRSLATVSARDAQTYRALHARLHPLFASQLLETLYAPPAPGRPLWELPADLQPYAALTPRQVVEALFESPQVQAAVLQQLAVPWGVLPDYAGMGSMALLALSGAAPLAVALGGAHATAQALIRALVRRGGRYQVLKPVRRVLVEDGAAVGVELSDGTRLYSRAVVSSSGLHQTLLEMVGAEHLDPALVARVQRFQLDEFALFAVHLALARPPRYDAADGAADAALRVLVGVETPDELASLWQEVRAGVLPAPRGLVAVVPSLFDARQAPPGHHTAVLLQPVPYAVTTSQGGGSVAAYWEAQREEYAARCVAAWRRYARNLTDQDILAQVPLTPHDIAVRYGNYARGALGMGRMSAAQAGGHRPLPELAQYRTPLRGLYLCGTCMHPGPGWLGAAGHNAAQIVARDLGLRPGG
jgi:phytoene dehydrogenase-like protein